MREMGVGAPRQSFSVVYINTTSSTSVIGPTRLGVYLLTEVIDGRFTESYFSGGDGTLFKEAWPGPTNANQLKESLRTNEETADLSQLIAFSEAINAATNDFDLAVAVKKFTKAKTWAAYLVVDRAMELWDGPINFRCVALM